MDAINIYPELISWRVNKEGLSQIAIRFDFKRKHISVEPIGHKIPSEFWDFSTRRVKSKYPNADLINSIIETTLNRHKTFILKRHAFGLPLNKEIIKGYLKTKSAFDDFYEYAERVIQEKKLKDGKVYSPDTMRRYRDEIKRMQTFKPVLHFNHITASFLASYKLWMQNTFKKRNGDSLEKNSIWKALGFIRMIYNEAIAQEIILPEGNPFKQFKVGSYEQNLKKIKYLELDQINALENELLTNKSLSELTQKVGWRFLSMCVSGMRISDAMLLDEYYFNDAGHLEFKPHKTRRNENVAQIPITTERQRRYFEITLQHKFSNSDPKTFRSTFNQHLKILAAAAGVNMVLTSHVGRHTMGGFLVDGGVEEKAAMSMLGVKSNKVIKTYLHLKQGKLQDEANKMKNVF